MLFGLLEELRADLEVDRKRVEVPDGCSEVSLVEAEGSPRHLILTPPKKEVRKMLAKCVMRAAISFHCLRG